MPEHKPTPAPTPHRAVYGFSLYMLFLTLFILYMLWALLPDKYLSGYLQLKYLPDKFFAVCLPMVASCCLFFFFFFIYPAINLSMTPDVDELSSVVDTKLALRLNNECNGCIWEQVTQSSVEKPELGTLFIEDKCEVCHEFHKRSAVPAIATLRFVDLSEMNKDYFS